MSKAFSKHRNQIVIVFFSTKSHKYHECHVAGEVVRQRSADQGVRMQWQLLGHQQHVLLEKRTEAQKHEQKHAETINSQHGGCIGCIAWGSDGVLRKHCPGHQLQILSRIGRSGLAMCTSPLHFGLTSQIAMEIISDQMPVDVTKMLLVLITIF